MRIASLLMVLLLPLTMLAQNDSTNVETPTTAQEVERLVDKYGEKAIDGINAVVEKAAPYAESGFKMVVRLQIAKGIGYMLPLVIFFIMLNMNLRETNRIRQLLVGDTPRNMDNRYGPWEESNVTFKMITTAIGMVVTGFLAVIFTYDGIMHLIAPEWFAIKEILDLF